MERVERVKVELRQELGREPSHEELTTRFRAA
jgi:DNA-directed RNA polymerase specialized sigma subunit